MDHTINQFENLKASVLRLPIELQQRLRDALNDSIANEPTGDVQPLTDEEVAEMMQVTPLTGAQIVASGATGAWKDKGIEAPVAWLKKEREQH